MAEKERNDDNTGKSEGKPGHGKRILLRTFGCQMNERDTEAVTGLMLDRGFETVSQLEDADVILYNTCSVRDHAEQKVFGRMGEFKKWKQRKPDLVIGILGCMAQQHGGNFFKQNPDIDLVCGTGNLSQVPDLVDEILAKRAPKLAIDRIDEEYGLDGIRYREGAVRANVNIMKGCDHKCTYCIVPFTRGAERSRYPESILKEMKDLESRGFKDVMLLGQNVNSYGKGLEEPVDFSDLLARINRETPGISRIRFITSHPKDAHTKLFSAMRDLENVCEHLHLPVQSGSDRVLRRMKREHTADWYREQVAEYRRLVPGGALSTDFIVGFPGETEKDFEETMNLVKDVEFDSAYIFSYSPRPGTPALKLEDDVTADEKSRRLQALLEAQRAISFKKCQAQIGKELEVLFESKTRKDEHRYVGRTRTFKRVVASSADDLSGKIRRVRVTASSDETLLGELLHS